MTINLNPPKNWRTTLAGLGVYIALAVQTMQHYGITHITEALNSTQFWIAFLVDTGLIAAKDSNVTGGTVPQTAEAVARTVPPADAPVPAPKPPGT